MEAHLDHEDYESLISAAGFDSNRIENVNHQQYLGLPFTGPTLLPKMLDSS